MRSILILLLLLGSLIGTAEGTETQPPSAKEARATVWRWGTAEAPKSATVSTWRQSIRNVDYALFQIRADLDLYLFVLTPSQLRAFIDALHVEPRVIVHASREQIGV